MLRRWYNSREIVNAGEALVDGLLSELIYNTTNWHALFGLLLSKNQSHRTGRGECDFVLVCEHGVLVLEIKGGMICYKDNQIIQKDIKGDDERVIDPFGQVRGNVDSIAKTIKARTQLDVFVGEAVVFPQSSFNYVGDSFKNFWHMQAHQSLSQYLEQTLKRQASNFNYEKLKAKEILQIVNALAPQINWENRSAQFYHSKKETEKQSQINHKILKGLEGNKRLLIEGPPGSGKSTFAQKLILDKVQKENIKILYLCWNEFLALHTQQFFVDNGVDENVTAMAYFDYVNSLFAIHPVEAVKLPFSEVSRIYEHVDKITTDLQSVNLLQAYDLIVIDEAQDLFHKGIDLVLDRQLNGGKNGLSKGRYIVFYDSLQAFDKGTNSELYQLVYHIIRESSAFYKLFEYFRTIAGSGIANFLDDTLKGAIDLSRLYGSDMVIKTYKDTDDCIITLKQWVRNVMGVEKVSKKDMVVLFSSNLVSGKNGTKNKRPLDTVLERDSEFEKLDNENINTISEKIRYTTALKYKGLEKDLVVLVINDLFNEKIQTFYQMYIGASRAKAKVILLIDEESARKIAHQKASVESMLVTDYLQ